MSRPATRGRARFWVICLAGLIAGAPGCSSLPGGSSKSEKLLPVAKDLREANAGVLPIPRELEKQPLPLYTVEPGDVLLIQPVDLDSPVRLPGDQPILPDGTINLGKFGQPVVMGRTVPEIEAIVKVAIQTQTKDPGFISVRIVARQSKVYYVLGEVNAPGAFQLSGRETVLDGIMAAGGLTDNASRVDIILVKPSHPEQCRTVLPVCYNQIVQLGDTTTNYQLAPGDRIYVGSHSLLEAIFGGRCKKGICDRGHHVPCGGACAPGCGTSENVVPTAKTPAPTTLPESVTSVPPATPASMTTPETKPASSSMPTKRPLWKTLFE